MSAGNWKSETSGDLGEASRRIAEVIDSIGGEPTDALLDSIWRAYLLVEKSIVFIKVEIDQDNPGQTVKMSAYSVPDERQSLQFALRNLGKGIESFRLGNFAQALKELRESRNYLRVLLRQKKLARRRKVS